MLSENKPDALEALTEFLYIVPVGLMQFGMDGTVQIANPLAVQLLMPLAPNGDLSNAFSALSPLVPDLARQVHEFTAQSGIMLDHQRCEVTRGTRSSVLSVTAHRTHGGTNLVVLDDVTALVEQERQIYADRQRFRAIFDNVRDYAIYTVDPHGLVDEWNQSLQRFGGWLPEDVAQRPIDMFFIEEERGAGRMESMLARARATGSVEMEGWRLRRDGSRLWANTVLTALPDVEGAVRGFVAVSRDMTERKRMEDELRRLATTDPLTGALNRRSGQALLTEAFRRVPVDGRRPGVLMLDIDHFKAINDHHGHDAGDTALCALVAVCHDTLGQRGAVARWGGEEFLVILPSTREDEAFAVAEELRSAIARSQIRILAGEISMTASVGVAVGGATPENMLHRADAALYAAKHSGRDRVVLSAPGSFDDMSSAGSRPA
ncbi:sensor domain-containing diguanylate cyclase [Falsiroseomonas sp. E2-1-a20]|uniref:sensor domain-containing diguanylate cyclase n=1 Tax=Falsiroseomonas sp. E2-1-a20 TaxID=3239300 RepID=UPI003F2AB294